MATMASEWRISTSLGAAHTPARVHFGGRYVNAAAQQYGVLLMHMRHEKLTHCNHYILCRLLFNIMSLMRPFLPMRVFWAGDPPPLSNPAGANMNVPRTHPLEKFSAKPRNGVITE